MKRGILWVGRIFVLIVYAVLLAYSVIVGMAFVLKLLGANPESDFADWVYRAAANITEPFRGIFPTTEIASNNRSVFDASLLFALMVYLVAAVVLHALITWLTRQITGIDRQKELEQRRAATLELQRQQVALGVPLATTTTPIVPPLEATPPEWAEPAVGAVAAPWPPESPTVPTAVSTPSDPMNPPLPPTPLP